jgi:hypothetical protein
MKLWIKALQSRLLNRPDQMSHRLTKSMGVLVGGTILSASGIGLIPFEQLPLPGYWIEIVYRTFSGLVWLAAIWYFYPQALVRFKVTLSKRLLIGLLIVLFFTAGSIYHADYAHKSMFDLFVGFLFALGIGLDEDFFSRGLIFGAFESYGIQIAAGATTNFLMHMRFVTRGFPDLARSTYMIFSAWIELLDNVF